MPAATTLTAVDHDEDAAIRRTWGANLTEQMDLLGVTTKRLVHLLAERGVTVSHQAVGQWRSGQNAPRPHVMVQVAAALGVAPRVLFSLDVIRVAA